MSTADNTYKKALRQHLKSKPQQSTTEWTPFRIAEKRYKARFPPPDLRDVLDLSQEGMSFSGNRGNVDTKQIKLISCGRRRAFGVPQIPGLVILPNYLSCKDQRSLIRWSVSKQARAPNDTNLDIHYVIPEEGLWNLHIRARREEDTSDSNSSSQYIIQPKRPSGPEWIDRSSFGPRELVNNVPVEPANFDTLHRRPKPPPLPSSHLPPIHASKLLPKLRWANIGYSYHWGTKTYDLVRPKAEYPQDLRKICKDVVASIDWHQVWDGIEDEDWGEQGPDWESWPESYEPDAGIVNFYQPRDMLCGHVDRSEVCSTSPLVSISLGNAAVFLIGGLTRSVEPVPILLRSGDIIVMSGPRCRRAYHGELRLPALLPGGRGAAYDTHNGGVPRILEGTLPLHLRSEADDDDWQSFAEYVNTTRININVRQVFPHGFDPGTRGS